MTHYFSDWWQWIVAHPRDVALAAAFALIFAIVMDLLAVGSRLRAGLRVIKNKWSERSVARLRKRIEQLQAYRDKIASYLTSDKALYLATLQIGDHAHNIFGYGRSAIWVIRCLSRC